MEGKTLAHFRIVTKLGEGGMGVVYKAEDLKLHRTVALKVLRAKFGRDEERTRRFVQEARTAAAITHPNIATIHQIDEADGVTFIAMEYIEGESLRARLGRGTVSLHETVRIAADIAAGLSAAHTANIIHRDLKPDNVMIDREGHVRILDFGLAKLLEEPPDTDENELSQMATMPQQLTREGKVFGTAAYMSPEQARGKSLDARSDIFSFGIMLYEMVTGRVPFKGETVTDTISMIIRDPAVPVTEIVPELPTELDRIIARCLHKEVEGRYQSSKDLLAELRALVRETDSGVSISGEPVSTPTTYHTGYSHTGYATPASGSGAVPTSGVITPQRSRRPLWVLMGILAVAVVFLAYQTLVSERATQSAGSRSQPVEANSLAVLTFENLKDPEDPERLGQILQELIITDLSNLEELKVYSSQRLFDLQKMLTGRETRTFDRQAATQVAEHAGAEAMLVGSLSQLGEQWILTVQLVDVATGTIRASRRIDGADLYAMVDELTDGVRGDLQMALASAEPMDDSIREKTSTSLEAYQHFLAGADHLNEMEFEKAVAAFDSAITIDPSFSRAYYQLAISKWWAGHSGEEAQAPLTHLLEADFELTEKEQGMAEASLALVSRRFDDAVTLYESLVEEYPDEKDAWYGLGESYYHHPVPRKTDALEAFVHAVRLDPQFFLSYRHIFDVYREKGMTDEAVDLAKLLIDLDPEDPYRYDTLIQALARGGDQEEFDAVVADARVRFPDRWSDAGVAQTLAWARLDQADYAEAAEGFARALELSQDSESIEAMRGLARTKIELMEYDEAEKWLEQAFGEISDRAGEKGIDKFADGLYQDLLDIFQAQGRYREGLVVLDSVRARGFDAPALAIPEVFFLALAGDERQLAAVAERGFETVLLPEQQNLLLLQSGWGYSQCGAYEPADSVLRSIEELGPRSLTPEFLGMRGYVALQLRNYPEAERDLLKGHTLNPTNGLLTMGLVSLYTTMGRYDDGIEYAREYVARRGGSPAAHLILVGALIRAGRLQEADQALAAAREALSSDPALRWLLVGHIWATPMGVAWHELAAGNVDRAAALVSEAADLDPDGSDPALHLVRGYLALQRGDRDLAASSFERGRDTSHPASHLRRENRTGLATLQLLNGDLDAAEREIRATIAEGPVHVRLQRLLGYVLAEQGRYEEALTLADEILTLDPGYGNQCLLAWLLVVSEVDVAQGAELAAWAAGLDPRVTEGAALSPYSSSAAYILGVAALRGGRYEEAVDWLEKAEAIQPHRTAIRVNLEEARDLLARTRG